VSGSARFRSDPSPSRVADRGFVFQDPSGRRWRWLRRLAAITALLIVAGLAAVAVAVATPSPGRSETASQVPGGPAGGAVQPAVTGDGPAAASPGITLGFDDPGAIGDAANRRRARAPHPPGAGLVPARRRRPGCGPA
jgi:hypothetical protein